MMVLKEGMTRMKVPGGKLMAVKLKYDDKIRELQVQGDFFVFPEDTLPVVENAVVGMSVGDGSGAFSERIRAAAESNKIELVGITPDAIAQAIELILRKGGAL
jgi:hypothetical protein